MIYLAAAYTIFWLITFILVFSIYQRQRSLQATLESLRQALEERERGHHPG